MSRKYHKGVAKSRANKNKERRYVNKSSRTLTITEPNPNLTKAKVLKAMENMVAHKAILANKQVVDGVKTAYLSEVIVTELNDEQVA